MERSVFLVENENRVFLSESMLHIRRMDREIEDLWNQLELGYRTYTVVTKYTDEIIDLQMVDALESLPVPYVSNSQFYERNIGSDSSETNKKRFARYIESLKNMLKKVWEYLKQKLRVLINFVSDIVRKILEMDKIYEDRIINLSRKVYREYTDLTHDFVKFDAFKEKFKTKQYTILDRKKWEYYTDAILKLYASFNIIATENLRRLNQYYTDLAKMNMMNTREVRILSHVSGNVKMQFEEISDYIKNTGMKDYLELFGIHLDMKLVKRVKTPLDDMPEEEIVFTVKYDSYKKNLEAPTSMTLQESGYEYRDIHNPRRAYSLIALLRNKNVFSGIIKSTKEYESVLKNLIGSLFTVPTLYSEHNTVYFHLPHQKEYFNDIIHICRSHVRFLTHFKTMSLQIHKVIFYLLSQYIRVMVAWVDCCKV